MTLKELKIRLISAVSAGHGYAKVSFVINGNHVSTITTALDAVDRIKDHNLSENKKDESGYTLKQAYQALYNEVKNSINQ